MGGSLPVTIEQQAWRLTAVMRLVVEQMQQDLLQRLLLRFFCHRIRHHLAEIIRRVAADDAL